MLRAELEGDDVCLLQLVLSLTGHHSQETVKEIERKMNRSRLASRVYRRLEPCECWVLSTLLRA